MDKFVFYKNESRIQDLLLFPNCSKFELEDQDSNYVDFVDENIVKQYKKMEEDLKAFYPRIQHFYFKDYSMELFIRRQYPFFGHETVKTYFEELRTLTEDQILEAIYIGLILNEAVATKEMYTVEKLKTDPTLFMALMDDLEAGDEEKWKIVKLIRSPRESLLGWLELVEQIEPIFNRYYDEAAEKVALYGQDLVERFNLPNQDTISMISNGMITKDLLASNRILVSFVNCCEVRLSVKDKIPYVLWGIENENFLKKIKLAEEEEQVNRILSYKNLGDKTRYEVLRCIANGMQSTKDIAQQLNVSSATISYHLNNLMTSKLIRLVYEDGKYYNKVNEEWIETCFMELKKDLKML